MLDAMRFYRLLAPRFFLVQVKETFEKRQFLFKFKKGENFNQRNTIEYFED
jgi:hypothetical protein